MVRNGFRAASLALLVIGLALSAGWAEARPALRGAHSRRMNTSEYIHKTSHSMVCLDAFNQTVFGRRTCSAYRCRTIP